ncbi:tripartite tricarboxylate transporter permease [Sinanaerobacter chloroacetimidivorans]|jgi:putative tricarboxylic transport membrane protein|uniref:Tripartite tricarboxylate transporter permease n=1 Tax=Sinanaerobacter chloroacetimidivorans TaxID=2818044 RepID=A0A8J7VZK3_9FIRM|nr:tripartite tricarboxylate transporter permease [Sinanaerobacter chloroacetimidivorans]MBR0597591.1 tripartite tricarboxylate transporter permease [Sinanaerobacter chloroacetimidivorans]
MSSLLLGLETAFQPEAMLFTILGTVLGIIFGALPGLTSTMAVALLIPVTFGLGPVAGMGMLVGAFCGGTAGGSVSATLLRIPGTPSSICTTFDAFPMAQKGQAGLALGTSVICSFIGGIFSLLVLSLLAPQLARFALKFGPLEYFSLAILGLTIIASISGESMIKGLLAGLIGVFASFVGIDQVTGMSRLTFGNANLLSGLSLLPVLIGLFAISQAFSEAEKVGEEKPAELSVKGKVKGEFPKFSLLVSKWKILLSSSMIGTLVGILPGAGGSIASFVAYDQAKRMSKEPDTFGSGNIEGVVASETSNNAMTGGALVPMLALGIPGDTCTAVMLGGLLIHGLRPGPLLFKDSMDVVYGIFFALLLANVAMLIFQFVGIRLFVKIMKVPRHLLTPLVLVLCTIGAYGASSNLFDVKVMLLFGVIGYFATKLGYGVAPIVLGFILGSMAELQLRRGAEMYSGISVLVERPISLILLIASVLLLAVPIWRKYKVKKVKIA